MPKKVYHKFAIGDTIVISPEWRQKIVIRGVEKTEQTAISADNLPHDLAFINQFAKVIATFEGKAEQWLRIRAKNDQIVWIPNAVVVLKPEATLADDNNPSLITGEGI